MRLRQLDKKGVYRSLVGQYTPPANSPFIGIWWNEKSEFQTFSLILNDEGMAIIGTSITPMGLYPWRRMEGNRAAIEISQTLERNPPPDEALDEKMPKALIVEWVAPSNALRIVTREGIAGELLKKQPGKPPKVKEILTRAKN